MSDEPFLEAAERLLARGLPTWFADQLQAARAETDRLLAPVPVRRRTVQRSTLERLLAVVAECSPCEHIGDGPASAVLWLPSRMTLCLPCASVAVALPAPPGCHWCRDGSADDVTSHAVQLGPLVVCGDACGRCVEGLSDAQ